MVYANRLRGGTRPIILKVEIHIITPEDAIWFCTLLSPLVLYSLLILNSRVPVFQVSSKNTCALSRGDGVGTVLPVLQTQVQSKN